MSQPKSLPKECPNCTLATLTTAVGLSALKAQHALATPPWHAVQAVDLSIQPAVPRIRSVLAIGLLIVVQMVSEMYLKQCFFADLGPTLTSIHNLAAQDCINVVTNFPICAAPTWNLYIYDASRNWYFCCPPGQYGVLPIAGSAGICKPEDVAVASSLVATPVSQAGGTAIATRSLTEATSTVKVTRTSTLRGGGITTVTDEVVATAEVTETSGYGDKSGGSGSRTSSSSKKSSKLATGAIAGIAIGAVFLLIAAAFAIWWGRRKANQNALKASADMYAATQQANQLGGAAVGPAYEASRPYEREYKSPAVSSGYMGAGYGSATPPMPPGNNNGQLGYSGTPPPFTASHTSPVEVPAALRNVERAEMGVGRQ